MALLSKPARLFRSALLLGTSEYCHQRSQYIRPNSKKNSFRGNHSRKYGIWNSNLELILTWTTDIEGKLLVSQGSWYSSRSVEYHYSEPKRRPFVMSASHSAYTHLWSCKLHVHGYQKQVGRMGNCPPRFWRNGKEDRNKNPLLFSHPEFSCFWCLWGCRYTVWSVNDVQLETPWIPAAVGLRQDKPIQFFFLKPLASFLYFSKFDTSIALRFYEEFEFSF